MDSDDFIDVSKLTGVKVAPKVKLAVSRQNASKKIKADCSIVGGEETHPSLGSEAELLQLRCKLSSLSEQEAKLQNEKQNTLRQIKGVLKRLNRLASPDPGPDTLCCEWASHSVFSAGLRCPFWNYNTYRGELSDACNCSICPRWEVAQLGVQFCDIAQGLAVNIENPSLESESKIESSPQDIENTQANNSNISLFSQFAVKLQATLKYLSPAEDRCKKATEILAGINFEDEPAEQIYKIDDWMDLAASSSSVHVQNLLLCSGVEALINKPVSGMHRSLTAISVNLENLVSMCIPECLQQEVAIYSFLIKILANQMAINYGTVLSTHLLVSVANYVTEISNAIMKTSSGGATCQHSSMHESAGVVGPQLKTLATTKSHVCSESAVPLSLMHTHHQDQECDDDWNFTLSQLDVVEELAIKKVGLF